MIKSIILFTVFLFFQFLTFQGFGQTITNVFSRLTGNTIDVTYSLSTPAPCEIALYVSLDGGTTWKGPLTKVQGDVGKNISAGEHTITWQVLEEFEELSSDNIKFKVESVGKKPYEPEMVFVEGGSFFIGNSSSSAKKLRPEEYPEHLAYVSSFLISKSEVTQAQWRLVMGSNPSIFKGCDQCPVENVSFNDVENFITKINSLTGKKYRLPTEAEWELAARGGLENTTGYYFSDTNELSFITEGEDEYGIPIRISVPHISQGWLLNNSESKTHKISTKTPNSIGLYDTSGNVAEWCSDWYDQYKEGTTFSPTGPEKGEKRVVRGGSFSDMPLASRFSSRRGILPSTKSSKIGFRLVQSVSDTHFAVSRSDEMEFAFNPIWSFLSLKNYIEMSEPTFIKKYSNPDSCKGIWNYLVSIDQTDLDESTFCDCLLSKNNEVCSEATALSRLYYYEGMTYVLLAPSSYSFWGSSILETREEAFNSFTRGIQIDNSYPQLFFSRSLCYENFGDNERRKDLEEAIRLDSLYTPAMNALAKVYSSLDNEEMAILLYAKLIDLQPNDIMAYEQASHMLENNGDFEGAMEIITDGIKNTDLKEYFYMRRAEIKKSSGDFRGAIADYTSAIEMDYGCSAYFDRAEAKYEIRDYIGSISDYTSYINCNSDDAAAYYLRGFAKFDFKDYTGAADDFTKSMEINKDHITSLLLWRGHSYFNNKKYSLAIADYSKVIQLNPVHDPECVIDAYYNRGLAKVYCGAKESGCQDLRKAADLGNEDAIDAVRENCQ